MMRLMYVAVFAFILQYGCKENPVNEGKSENHSPAIISLIVFPEFVGPSDSLVVVCNAVDPDADTLVYDWYTSGVVRIKGALPGLPVLLHTYENSRIFYAPDSQHVAAPQDTFRVQCAVRDVKGGQAVDAVSFFVIRSP